MICEKCGQQLDDGSKFCTSCGAQIEAAQAVQETAAVLESTVSEVQEEIPVAQPEAVVEPIKASPSKPVQFEQPQEQWEPAVQPVNEPKPAKTTPLPVWKYIGIFLLTSIPIVGAIMILVWSFGSSFNKNTQNYARAVFILFIISLILSIAGAIVYWEALKLFLGSLGSYKMNF